MTSGKLHVVRRPETLLYSDDRRVITRYLNLHHPPRIRSVVRRVMKLSPREVSAVLGGVLRSFARRHRDLKFELEANFRQVARHIARHGEIAEDRRLLIGAYLTQEYSIESAALFNPSLVMHPDQGGVEAGSARFLMSLRATGEGHISSIVFRRGLIDAAARLSFDPAPRYAHAARPAADRLLDKSLFGSKFREIYDGGELGKALFSGLPDPFGLAHLKAAIEKAAKAADSPAAFKPLAAQILWLASANYELDFPADCPPAEMVIFPATAYEQNGMEDLRLVRFANDDGSTRYYGTYTAYDGRRTHPMLLETADFHHFHVGPFTGRFARNKGMALFPRKVDGAYMMAARYDGENLSLLRSQSLHVWNVAQKLQAPAEAWEALQVGNCGSPLETEAGWILLTHGVGPMRQYCLGALLLDLKDPGKVIGRLREPLLAPTRREREGYVPNVLYSCGSLIHHGQLVIPYAMSDSRTAFATVAVDDLVGHLLAGRPRRARKKAQVETRN